MKRKIVSRYISIVFIVATFMGVFHHHNDLLNHTDCQLCTIQHSIADADAPTEVEYFTKIDIYSFAITAEIPVFHPTYPHTTLHARAPPFYS